MEKRVVYNLIKTQRSLKKKMLEKVQTLDKAEMFIHSSLASVRTRSQSLRDGSVRTWFWAQRRGPQPQEPVCPWVQWNSKRHLTHTRTHVHSLTHSALTTHGSTSKNLLARILNENADGLRRMRHIHVTLTWAAESRWRSWGSASSTSRF